MSIDKNISDLEALWDNFLMPIREGIFDCDYVEIAIETIKSISTEKDTIDKNIVKLTWFIPVFLNWNRIRVIENSGDIQKFDRFNDDLIEILEDKLGVP